MSDKAPDNSSPGYTAAEFRQFGKLAAQAGLSIEGFKRECVRAYLSQPPPNAKVGRGWIAIGLDGWSEQRCRKVADLAGIPFQLFCRFALMEYAETLEKTFAECEKLPRKPIKVWAALRDLCWKVGGVSPAKN